MHMNRITVVAILLSLSTSFPVLAAEQAAVTSAASSPTAVSSTENSQKIVIPPEENGEALNVDDFKGVEMVSSGTVTLGDGYAASQADQNALLIKNGANVTVLHSNISKLGNTTSIKGSRLNGQNAVVTVINSNASLEGCVLHSQADGSAALFAVGEQGKIKAHNSNIRTAGLWAPGIAVSKAGKAEANNVNIGTTGARSAAVSAAGGKSSVTVTQSTLSTGGAESPIVYSGGDVSLSEVRGGTGVSDLVVVEGSNAAHLEYADLTGGGSEGVLLFRQLKERPDANHVSRFSAKHCTLRHAGAGPMFFVTNTNGRIYAEMTGLQHEGDVLAKVAAGKWGAEGNNGGNLVFMGNQQSMSGNFDVDALSTLTIDLQNESHWYGTVNKERTAKEVKVGLDAKSTWNMTDDAYVTVFTDADSTLANVTGNGHHLYYDASQTANQWLGGRTIALPGGGTITPAPAVK
jgi:hypothetical protein